MRTILTPSNNNTEAVAGLHFTMEHSGKMAGIISLSTSAELNKFCNLRREHNTTICSHCFAFTLLKLRPTMRPHMEKNTEILTSFVIPSDKLPTIPSQLVRFESFGELNNATQVINYFNVAKVNPRSKFALWTKNPRFIAEAIKQGAKKPSNLQIVLSSTMTNIPTTTGFDFVDKIFTVYDSKTVKKDGIDINCGAKSCLGCQTCYKKNPKDVSILHVREKLK